MREREKRRERGLQKIGEEEGEKKICKIPYNICGVCIVLYICVRLSFL